MRKSVVCYHPQLIPTQWNQSRPEPWHGFTCECGQNWCCPICGYGQGYYPCGCHKNLSWGEAVEIIMKERESTWRKLADGVP